MYPKQEIEKRALPSLQGILFERHEISMIPVFQHPSLLFYNRNHRPQIAKIESYNRQYCQLFLFLINYHL